MTHAANLDEQPDPHHRLSADLYRIAVFRLHREVPPPDVDDPEQIARFINASIAEIASMVPANAEEVGIAVRVVSADAQAAECIRHARRLFDDPSQAMKCQAQASHCMRTANAARALLLRVQAVRRKRDAVPATCTEDAWTIHATEGFLAAAAEGGPVVEIPVPQPGAETAGKADPEDDDKFARYDAAEQYAVLHPRRAAEIRAHGGVPPKAGYPGPEQETVLSIIASTSPLLQQIDRDYGLGASPSERAMRQM
ncbi:MAG TPA: hypothetical protein VFL55_05415 [Acetobacteraceae bacterium]|nr:hypothetical protein [Acetobacteraceae bacterium]